MEASPSYLPSQALTGETEHLRRHSFTRWMSRDLLQAATDFCRNIGLYPLYTECSPEHLTRYLFWRLPQGAYLEVRSGRTEEQFQEFDRVNLAKGWLLLTLHVNENDRYSAVWISSAHYAAATVVLAVYGVTPARRKPEA